MENADIRFSEVRKVFPNGVVALESFSLDIAAPKLVVLVGPSGCGKTTLLRLIAGLERPTSGSIHLGERRLDALAPRERDVAMVFQSYALYPHMTVRENLSFGLQIRKTPKDVVRGRVEDAARELDIQHLLDRKPGELSGGQRQRVALGRAIVREPKVFLFDEPLSNLDARLRDEMRYMIKRLYQRLGITMVYVTHDQVEAMTIGELLVVLKDGRIHQVGSPSECYRRPRDTFVASFLGSPPMNLLRGRYDASAHLVALGAGARFGVDERQSRVFDEHGETDVVVGVRPEHLVATAGGSASNGLTLTGRVILRETLGHELLTHVAVGDEEIIVRASESQAAGVPAEGSFEATDVHFFSGRSGLRLDPASGA